MSAPILRAFEVEIEPNVVPIEPIVRGFEAEIDPLTIPIEPIVRGFEAEVTFMPSVPFYFDGSFPIAGLQQLAPKKRPEGALGVTGVATPRPTKSLSGALNLAKFLINKFNNSFFAYFGGGLVKQGDLVKKAQRISTGALATSGSVFTLYMKRLYGALTSLAGVTFVAMARAMYGSLLLSSGPLKKSAVKVSSAFLSQLLGTVRTTYGKNLSGLLSPTSSLVRLARHSLAASLSMTRFLTKTVSIPALAVLSIAGLLTKGAVKILSSAISFSSTLIPSKIVFIVTSVAPKIVAGVQFLKLRVRGRIR